MQVDHLHQKGNDAPRGPALVATILGGVKFALERMKQVLEPAGAAALAAVLFGRIPIADGERVAVVASGGNIDVGRLGELLAMAAQIQGDPAAG